MNNLETKYQWLAAPQVFTTSVPSLLAGAHNSAAEQAYVSLKHEVDKVIVFERADVLFIFNFHPTNSFTDYRVGVDVAGEYRIVLSSDEKRFGGFDNIQLDTTFVTTALEWNNRKNWVQVRFPQAVMHCLGSLLRGRRQVYIPSRTCMVLALK